MRTLIIAEAGVNHNGCIDRAVRMVSVAHNAGADVIKFQTFRAEDLVTDYAAKAAYQTETDGESSQYDMLRRLELSDDDFRLLRDECERIGIGFMSTPFSLSAARFLHKLGMKTWKIASGEVTNLPLLEYVASVAESVIMSTGMCTTSDIECALRAMNSAGLSHDHITLLHCTTAYPAPFDTVNLRAMNTLRQFGCASVGYSDHTEGTLVAAAAVAAGATVIEKHFTLDKSLPGPDHRASLNPDELARMVEDIRVVETAMGCDTKMPGNTEILNAAVARKSVVAACDITRGDIFSERNITTKRPAGGISPMRWHDIIGRSATQNYYKDQQINPNELL